MRLRAKLSSIPEVTYRTVRGRGKAQCHRGSDDISNRHLGIVCPMANESANGVRFVDDVPVACEAKRFRAIDFEMALAHGCDWILEIDAQASFRKEGGVAFGGGSWCPVNSQNMTWWREAFPLLDASRRHLAKLRDAKDRARERLGGALPRAHGAACA
jgi:hypothetical protein